MSGLLFITAPEADHKLINRLLLHLKDWEYGSGDRYKLVTSKSVQALGEGPYVGGSSVALMKPTPAPADPDPVNEWAGASTADVEAFCLALDASGIKGLNAHLFVALDADGVRDMDCVLAERVIDWATDPIQYPERSNKARVPWCRTYLTWANLDISNLLWEEYMLEDAGRGNEGGWWTYNAKYPLVSLSDEKRRLKDEAMSRLEGEGRA